MLGFAQMDILLSSVLLPSSEISGSNSNSVLLLEELPDGFLKLSHQHCVRFCFSYTLVTPECCLSFYQSHLSGCHSLDYFLAISSAVERS